MSAVFTCFFCFLKDSIAKQLACFYYLVFLILIEHIIKTVETNSTGGSFHAKRDEDLFYIAPEGASISNDRGFAFVLPDENGNVKIALSALQAMLAPYPNQNLSEEERAKRDVALFYKTYTKDFTIYATRMVYSIYTCTELFKHFLCTPPAPETRQQYEQHIEQDEQHIEECEQHMNELQESQTALWATVCVVRLSAVTSINFNTLMPIIPNSGIASISPLVQASYNTLEIRTADSAVKISSIINKLAQVIFKINNAADNEQVVEMLASMNPLSLELESCMSTQHPIRLKYMGFVLETETPLSKALIPLVLTYSQERAAPDTVNIHLQDTSLFPSIVLS